MPPTLALLLCCAFVFFLLRLDRKQAGKISHVSWLPTIWVLLVASKPLSSWLGLNEPGGDEGSPLDRAVLIGLLCFGFLLLLKRKVDWSSIRNENAWLILLICYTFVSISWSDVPYISFKRWVRDLLAVVMVLIVLTEQDPRQAVQNILRRTTYILIPFSLLLVKYYPYYGVGYGPWGGELMWIGVASQKNGLGRLCLISISFLVWTRIRRWQGREVAVGRQQTRAEVLLTAISLWLLIGGGVSTYSATAVAALSAGLVMLLSFLLVKKRAVPFLARSWRIIIVLIFLFGTALPFFVAGGSLDSGLISILGREQTLTGRTDIWAVLMELFDLNPILGYGVGGFWTSERQMAVYGMKEAHNGYLALCLELGFIGLLLMAMFLLSILRNAQRALVHDADWGIFCLCFALMFVTHNIAESSINAFDRHLTAILLLLSVVVALASRRSSGESRPLARPGGIHYKQTIL